MTKIEKIEDLVDFISPFYPNLDVDNYQIIEFESALTDVYISLIGKILMYSPQNLRLFLRSYLLKFEIKNVKKILLNSLLGRNYEEKRENINYEVEMLLNRRRFFDKLLKLNTLDEILFYMEKTRYHKIIKEGLIYFKKNNEIFMLEAFLDKMFYDNLLKNIQKFNKKEKNIILPFVQYITELYNIRIIFRGIRNDIDRQLMKQLIINEYLYLNEEIISNLTECQDQKEFSRIFYRFLSNHKELQQYFEIHNSHKKNLMKFSNIIYQDHYFSELDIAIDDFDSVTIAGILELLIKKEFEIKNHIIPMIIKILHQKFKILEMN